ncbi:LysR substrate-binding domain-containing protein [Pleionea mediterranea]|jgi:LysR family cys regulon transcriptional activator|uniref:LysR family cys regulon transcriptional activator n=1 Tax=Pleionea mediterranea TaxID=523701 RepID=A0A316FMA5_9GAMM|nr:LysR substrate-binding domain-containing protein [Pleionea mediterranea]PWK50028.1 LysR family cys regulon transcriptional activator [Pleionea mediterranea]
MKLQQLRYLLAIADNDLNITAASEKLYTSQPGVSKQLKLLEEELGLRLFSRNGKSLDGITYAGNLVLEKAASIMHEVDNIKQLAHELQNEQEGSLSIGTTHTQARYVLPDILQAFRKRYPDVKLNLHQGTSEQISEMMKNGLIDFAIASSTGAKSNDTVSLPCYHWDRAILMPQDHPLAKLDDIELSDLAQYPIITYVFSQNGKSSFRDAFAKEGLTPNIAITARDADVIKTYVRKGLGIGIAASMAYDPDLDDDLVAISTHDILPSCTTWLGFREEQYVRSYMYDFIEMVAPHLDRSTVNTAIHEYRRTGQINSIKEHSLPYKLIERPTGKNKVAA